MEKRFNFSAYKKLLNLEENSKIFFSSNSFNLNVNF